MAFTFKSRTLSGHIDESEVIVFDMIRLLGLQLPLLTHLEETFYDSPRIAREQVGALRAEALTAMRAFDASLNHRPSAFERTLNTRTPVFREMAKEKGLKPSDPERCLATLVAVCDDALEHDAEIECISD
jgi:hypothetical protein